MSARAIQLIEEALAIFKQRKHSAPAPSPLACACRVHPTIRDGQGMPLVIEMCMDCTARERRGEEVAQ